MEVPVTGPTVDADGSVDGKLGCEKTYKFTSSSLVEAELKVYLRTNTYVVPVEYAGAE